MAITLILTMFVALLNFIVNLIGLNLPSMPAAVSDIGAFLSNFIGGGFGIVNYVYSPPLTGALLAMILAIIFFEQGYKLSRFILRQLRIMK